MPDDTYWSSPQLSFDDRRRLYLGYCAAHSPTGRMDFLSQIARLELGLPVDEGPIREGIAFADSRQDCCDFALAGLLRIVYRYRGSPLLSTSLLADIEACLLRFKYWWDEPGDNRRCYWTENHQIIFHAGELLAGQLFPGRVFANNGQTGAQHVQHALILMRRWFAWRVRFGFSEWLSNCYFEEDLLALVNLYDFAEQPDIRQLAAGLIDVIMFEMALHTYRGVMGCSHGRTYTRLIKGARNEDAASTAKMMFGMGLYNRPANLGTVPLATSGYRCPPILEKIAQDLAAPMLAKELHSLNMEDAPRYGLSYDRLEDANLYWSIQDYLHEKVVGLTRRLEELYDMRHPGYEDRYAQVLRWQAAEYGRVVDRNLDVHALTEVNVQTYRTPYYMLSCAQDYRAGKPGYQQHPWQATLGIDAVLFTNHPGAEDETSRPNYWAGNGILPRTVQHLNVLVCLHHIPPDDAFPFSHAYFPCATFDEVIEQNQWICARKDDGYVALYSQHPYHWRPDEQGQDIEMRVDTANNVWLCELGDREHYTDFSSFVRAISGSAITCHGLQVDYDSPALGHVTFGWHGDLQVAGQPIAVHNYARFDNPYCQSAFAESALVIRRQCEEHAIDFELARREAC